MNFKEKVVKYLRDHDVNVNTVEQQGELCIVCHIPQSDNIKVANMKDVMEVSLNVIVAQSDMFGMNVVIVESNDLDEEDEYEDE